LINLKTNKKIPDGTRFAQANREAFLSLLLALMYMAWWYFTAYGLGAGPVEDYSYIMGFPSWFFLSCIAGFFIFALLSFAMVRMFFVEIPLTDENRVSQDNGESSCG